MEQKENKKSELKYEEMDEVQEFSLGGLGIGAMVVTVIAIIAQFFMQL